MAQPTAETHVFTAVYCNQEALEEVKAALGEKFSSVLQLYLRDTRTRLGDIERALGDGKDISKVAISAHSIRSASAHMGATRMAEVATSMEHTAGHVTEHHKLPQLFTQMKEVFAETEKVYEPLCGTAA